ncbi:predicted enzyme of the cupin superfamily [Moorella thermoacetica Y72]|uniref:Predicted enzyme of the cupin superfamily n=1 Tax=Moorella thermoacetica Y72 TaxID=1325331 RepID=A0A0S6UCI2_NEOTH|nr:predicted enzyme of the cupin superfamily [Moorella thermoacetica Y72]
MQKGPQSKTTILHICTRKFLFQTIQALLEGCHTLAGCIKLLPEGFKAVIYRFLDITAGDYRVLLGAGSGRSRPGATSQPKPQA